MRRSEVRLLSPAPRSSLFIDILITYLKKSVGTPQLTPQYQGYRPSISAGMTLAGWAEACCAFGVSEDCCRGGVGLTAVVIVTTQIH